MGILGVAMMIFALVEVYTFHFLALGHLRYSVVLAVGVGLQAVLFPLLHATAEQLVYVQIIVAVVLLVLSEIFDRSSRREPAGVAQSAASGGPIGASP